MCIRDRFGEQDGTTLPITTTEVITRSTTHIGEHMDMAPGTTLTPGSMGRPVASMVHTAVSDSVHAITLAPEPTHAEHSLMVHTELEELLRRTTRGQEHMRKQDRGQESTVVGVRPRCSVVMTGPVPNGLPIAIPATQLA